MTLNLLKPGLLLVNYWVSYAKIEISSVYVVRVTPPFHWLINTFFSSNMSAL